MVNIKLSVNYVLEHVGSNIPRSYDVFTHVESFRYYVRHVLEEPTQPAGGS